MLRKTHCYSYRCAGYLAGRLSVIWSGASLQLFFKFHFLWQVVNYNHVMPTRYSVDISFDKANLNKETLKVSKAHK